MRADRKRLVSLVITAGLVLGAVLLAPSSAAGISVTVSPAASDFVVAQTINLSGSVSLSNAEFNRITSVDLVIAGPQGCTASLPLNTNPYSTTAIVDQVVSCSPSGSGNLTVDVTYSGISVVDGYGYGYGYGDGLLGSGSSATITFNIDWRPPAFLDPAPLFTLLPNSTSLFSVPVIPVPTLAAGLPDTLPTLTDGFDIPVVVEVDPNAPDPLPSLTPLTASLPLLTSAVAGAPQVLPSSGAISDIVGAIPLATDPSLVAGVSQLPSSTAWLTGLGKIEGLDTDGTYIYVLIDSGSSAVDSIRKYDSSGALVTAFDSDGIADVKTSAGQNVTVAEAIAYAAGALWVSHNQQTVDDEGSGNQRVFLKFNATTGAAMTTDCLPNFAGNWQQKIEAMAGNGGNDIWAQSLSDDQRGFRFNASDGCSRTNDWNPNYDRPYAMGYDGTNNVLYTVNGAGEIKTHTSNNPQDTATDVGTVTGFTSSAPGGFLIDSSGVLYIANGEGVTAGSTDGVIHKAQPASALSTSPRGMTYDPVNEHLYLLVNGPSSSNDWMLKLTTAGVQVGDAINTGVRMAAGLAYLSGSVYVFWENDQQNMKAKGWNVSGEAFGSPFTLTTQYQGWGAEAFTSDGSTLFGYRGSSSSWSTWDTSGDADESGECNNCTSISNGAKAAAYRSSKGQYFLAKNNDIDMIAALDGQSTTNSSTFSDLTDGTSNLKIKGMTFVGNVLYMADDAGDQILKASIPTGETTNPVALTNDGTFLWAITNGTSGSDTLLKLNASTGAKVTGYALARDDAEGLAYHNSALWVLFSPSNGGCKIQQVNPSNGSNVGSLVSIGDQGWCDGFGGMSSDGTNLWVHAKGGERVYSYDTNGTQDTQKENMEFSSGAHAVAYRTSASQLWVAKGSKIDAFTTSGGGGGGGNQLSQVSGVAQTGLTVNNGTTSGTLAAKGMTWMGSVLYVVDDTTDNIYKTSAPAGSNDVLGMTSDGTSLYLLVNNSPNDSIMKVDTSGNKVTAWATSGLASTSASDARSIAVVGSSLWVAELQDSGYGGNSWSFTSYSLTDGSAGGTFSENNVPWGNAQPNGMGSDGTYIYLATSTGTMQKYDTSGNTVGQQADLQGHSNGVTALVVRSGSPRILAVNNNDLRTYGIDGGSSMDTYSLSGVSVAGLTTIGSVVYLADTTSNSVKKAAIPLPTTVITTTPKAMTTDGTDLFIVIEASPKDRIIKVNTAGVLQTSFGTNGVAVAPSDNVAGLAFAGSTLYAVGSEQQSCPPSCGGGGGAALWTLNASTGATTATTTYNNMWGQFTGLSYDGTDLIATVIDGGYWYFNKINPSFLSTNDQVDVMNTMGMSSPGSIVYGAGGNWVAQSSGSMLAAFTLAGWDANATSTFNLTGLTGVNGMAYIDTTVYLADSALSQVFGATFQANKPELTIAGSYTSTLLADFIGDDLASSTYTSPSSAFTVTRATSVEVAITSPADDSTVTVAVGEDATLDANRKVTVTGTVDDPSVTSIILGAELASTTLFADSADDGSTSEALFTVTNTSASVGWHIDTDSFSTSGSGAWHYATDVQGSGTFDDGSTNSGSLTIAEGVPIGEGGKLSFQSWYNSEGYEGVDKKILEVDIVGDDPDVGWVALRQIVDPFALAYASPPQNAHSSFAFIGQQPGDFGFSMGGAFDPGFQPCPPDCGGGGYYQIMASHESFNNPAWLQVQVPLTAFVGESLNIRWRFDTVDDVFNNLEGWYIDDILIEGKGSGGGAETTPVTNGTFTATFTGLAEGENEVSVTAVIPYDSTITDIATITVKLDSLSPVTTITQDTVVSTTVADLITSELSYTVTGTFVETNYSKISAQNDIGAANAVPVFALVDEDAGTFSATANLFEGNNTITVTITDGAGRTGSDTVIIQRDTVGPTFTTIATVYPVGSVSARPGDPMIFQLDAADAASDIQCVEVLFDPNSQVAPCTGGSPGEVEPFRRPAAIPSAVRDAWGTTGGWLLPVQVPSGTLAGNYPLTIRIVDTGGTVTTTTLNAAITASLSAFNLALLPDENLVSIPLIPDDRAAANLPRLLDLNPTVRDLTTQIWHYDASLTNLPQEDRWTVYTPDGNSINDTLLNLKTGRGYWWNTDSTKFTMSDPLRVGQPATPKPENFTYSGSSLVIGNEAPELYRTVPGWNLVGVHAEQEPLVSDYFAQHGRGDAALYSVIEFRKLITFPIADRDAEPTFDLGFFSNLALTDTLRLGSGIWFNTPSAGTYAFSG